MAVKVERGFNSFSGVDIKGVFHNRIVAEMQAISYSITREKAPLYTMGAADPRSFSRGKRGIAGTLIFIMFDRHALLGEFGAFSDNAPPEMQFLSDIDDLRPEGTPGTVAAENSVNGFLSGSVGLSETSLPNTVADDQALALPWFADQIPPFDITLAAANEYGSMAVMRLYGIELLNEGYGVSIDDIVSEMQHTYVARTIVGWRPVATPEDKKVNIPSATG